MKTCELTFEHCIKVVNSDPYLKGYVKKIMSIKKFDQEQALVYCLEKVTAPRPVRKIS